MGVPPVVGIRILQYPIIWVSIKSVKGVSMNGKRIYSFAFLILLVSWSIFGFVAAGPANAQPVMQETIVVPPISTTVIAPQTTPIVPVTGNESTAAPYVMIWLFYGFLGMIAIVLLIAFAASVKRTASTHSESSTTPSDEHT